MKYIVATLILIPVLAFAYIPSADFIFSKIVQNSGRGIYQIRQEISFPTAERVVTVSETWWILSENVMFLKAAGPLFTHYVLYKNGRKYFFTPEGKFVTSVLPKDFFENLYFYRSSQQLKEAVINKKIVPAQMFRKRPIPKAPKDLATITNEPYLKLARLKDGIAFQMGYTSQDEQSPGLWVEQDRFLIKKLRFPDQVEVSVDSFSELSRGLIYPKTQKISWGNQYAMVELSRGDALNKKTEFFEEKLFSKLSSQNKPIPEDLSAGAVGEFYKRFR